MDSNVAEPVSIVSRRIFRSSSSLSNGTMISLSKQPRTSVLVQDLLEQVMHWHLVLLAALFVESQSPADAIMIIIVNFEFQYRAHTGEAVKHRGDERQVP